MHGLTNPKFKTSKKVTFAICIEKKTVQLITYQIKSKQITINTQLHKVFIYCSYMFPPYGVMIRLTFRAY